MALFMNFAPRDAIFDNTVLPLADVRDVHAISGTSHVFAASAGDNAISRYEIAPDGYLIYRGAVTDTAALQIHEARHVTSLQVGSETFVYAAGTEGISAFDSQLGSIQDVAAIGPAPIIALLPTVVSGPAVPTPAPFLVAAKADGSLIAYRTQADGSLNVADRTAATDGATINDAAIVSGTNFSFVVRGVDTGAAFDTLEVWRLTKAGQLVLADSVRGNANRLTGGVDQIATVTVEGRNLVVAYGNADQSLGIFELGQHGALDLVRSIKGVGPVAEIDTLVIDGQVFLALSDGERATALWHVKANGVLTGGPVLTDTFDTALRGAAGSTLAISDGRAFLVAAGRLESGLTSFEIGPGDDNFEGGSANDVFLGFSGNDTMYGGGGADLMLGGAGDDFYSGADLKDTIVEAEGAGIDTVSARSGSFTLPDNVERLLAEALDRRFVGIGNDLDNYIRGGNAGDRLDGGNGNDTLDGGAGSDTLLGGAGNDAYMAPTDDIIVEEPGGGIDTIHAVSGFSLDSPTYANIENLVVGGGEGIGNPLDNAITGPGTSATLRGRGGNDTLTGMSGNDLLYGEDGHDALAGNDGADTLNGGDGDDTLLGGASLDTLSGGEGNDRLEGGSSDDRLDGGTGNDTLVGGGGRDAMIGGSGGDVFGFASANMGSDRIDDFSTAEDRFDLSGGLFLDRTEAGPSTTLTHAGGTILIVGVTGLTLAEWNALVMPSGNATAAASAPATQAHSNDHVCRFAPDAMPAWTAPLGSADFMFP